MPYARPNHAHTGSESRFSPAEHSPPVSSTQVSVQPRAVDSAWQHRLGVTFSQLSEQFRDASQVLFTVNPSSEDAATSLSERLGYIEERQKNLEAEIRSLREIISTPREISTTEVEDQLKAHIALYKLDQERLHGRLQNALATKSLSPVKMLPTKNGKLPPNAPTTRGEFEHLTKERYDGILACYDIQMPGDTATKRESLRAFLGIPVAPIEKK